MELFDLTLEQKFICLCHEHKRVSYNIQMEDIYYEKHKKIYKAFLDGVFDLSIETDARRYGVDQGDFFACLMTSEFSFSLIKEYEGKLSGLATRRRKVDEYRAGIDRMTDMSYEVVSDSIPVSSSKSSSKEEIMIEWNNTKKIELNQFGKLSDRMYTFSPGHCMLLAGTSGTGKTNFAIQLAEDIAACQDEEWLFMSLEMPKKSVAERIAKIYYYECNPDGNLYHSNLFFEQNKSHPEFYDKIMYDRMHICDKSGITIDQIKSTIKYEVTKNPRIKTVVIDYAQLVRGKGSIFEKMDYISEMTPLIAKDYGVRVILLCQLTKDSYDNQKPSPSHIKGAGGLFDNMDAVMCLYKDKSVEDNRRLEVMIWKDRHSGSSGQVDMLMNGLHLVGVDYNYFQQ